MPYFLNIYIVCVILLIIVYLLVRLINLTLLPIFNDEAIYLDWGARMTEAGGDLYYSLADSKQPLLMWLFGIFQKFISDPLFAGRLVSVLAGITTLIGIYKLSHTIFNRKIAQIAGLLYIFTPIFIFFDRQALMEAGIASVGIWSCFFLIKLIDKKENRYAWLLGLILGLGFLIKSSALIFIALSFIIMLFVAFKKREKKILRLLTITACAIIATNAIIIINPKFWTIFSDNRYTYNISEVASFAWTANISSNLNIMFFYLTPLVFIAVLISLFKIFKQKEHTSQILAAWFILGIAFETVLGKNPSQRYLVSFLPAAVIFASYFLYNFSKNKIVILMSSFVVFSIPIALSLLLIFKPVTYIQELSKITKFSELEYIEGQTSGFGVKETLDYVKNIKTDKKKFISVALNAGNPESAILAYLDREKAIGNGYLDSKLLGEQIKGIDCLISNYDNYFISRDDELAGLNKYLEKVHEVKKPYGKNYIGIYKFRGNCKGNTLKVRPTKLAN